MCYTYTRAYPSNCLRDYDIWLSGLICLPSLLSHLETFWALKAISEDAPVICYSLFTSCINLFRDDSKDGQGPVVLPAQTSSDVTNKHTEQKSGKKGLEESIYL